MSLLARGSFTTLASSGPRPMRTGYRELSVLLSDPKFRTLIEKRFWSKVEKSDSCWIWKATKERKGYGLFYLLPQQRAHRVAYQLIKGDIPENLVLDHLCRNTSCVNPSHLEPISNQLNVKKGYSLRTHCPRGHPLSGDNLSPSKLKKGWRVCITCMRLKDNERHKRDWEKRNALKRERYYAHQMERQQYAKDYYYAKKEVIG